MNNTKQIIDNHNKRILNPPVHTDETANNATSSKTCNCRQKNTCPLNGNCLQSSVMYQAIVKRKDNNTSETYIGLTEITLHHSVTQNTETRPNKANISGLLKTRALTTLSHGGSFHQAPPTIARAKDATFALRKKIFNNLPT